MSLQDDYGFELMEEDCATTSEFICGTEYEIEDVYKVHLDGYDVGSDTPFWFGDLGAVKDGSLRNNGIEFVTKLHVLW